MTSGNDKGPVIGCSHQSEIRMERQGNSALKKPTTLLLENGNGYSKMDGSISIRSKIG